jgi:5-dehydro-2-deoxygluconokinase
MIRGYGQPLYLLQLEGLCGSSGAEPPWPAALQAAEVGDAIELAYDGLLQALADGVPAESAGVVVDEAFGSRLGGDVRQRGVITALATGAGSGEECDAEHGAQAAARIEAFAPTFAQAFVAYNPLGDRETNRRRCEQLARLSDHCRHSGRRLLLELSVPATAGQLAQVNGDRSAYELQTRPLLMQRAVRELQRAGIEPDVWMFEGLARRDDCAHIVATVRHNGRASVGCLMLGRGADEAALNRWLDTAARVEGYLGFAAGAAIHQEALQAWRARTLPRADAVALIARRFGAWAGIFENERRSRAAEAPGSETDDRAL